MPARDLFVIPGPAEGRNPESSSKYHIRPLDSGFALRAARNDKYYFAGGTSE